MKCEQNMSLCLRKQTIWVPTRSITNRAVQPQKQATSLKFGILEKEGLCYLRNKNADQLCSYCTADLRLCFRICRLLVFSCRGSYPFLLIFENDAVNKQ